MSKSAGRVVVWQWRYICLEEWQNCTQEFAEAIKCDVRCETRALVPEQLLVDLETRVRALADDMRYESIIADLRALTQTSTEEKKT